MTRSAAIYSFHSYFSMVWSLLLLLFFSLSLEVDEPCLRRISLVCHHPEHEQGNIVEKRDTLTPIHVREGSGSLGGQPLHNSLNGKWMPIGEIELKRK